MQLPTSPHTQKHTITDKSIAVESIPSIATASVAAFCIMAVLTAPADLHPAFVNICTRNKVQSHTMVYPLGMISLFSLSLSLSLATCLSVCLSLPPPFLSLIPPPPPFLSHLSLFQSLLQIHTCTSASILIENIACTTTTGIRSRSVCAVMGTHGSTSCTLINI